MQRIREGEGFKDARGVFSDAVLVGLYAVLTVHYAVGAPEQLRKFLLVVVSLAFLAAETLVPFVEGNLGNLGGVLDIEGVEPCQFEGVAYGEEGVAGVGAGCGVAQGYVVLELERVLELKGVGDADCIRRVYQQLLGAVWRRGKAVRGRAETVGAAVGNGCVEAV